MVEVFVHDKLIAKACIKNKPPARRFLSPFVNFGNRNRLPWYFD